MQGKGTLSSSEAKKRQMKNQFMHHLSHFTTLCLGYNLDQKNGKIITLTKLNVAEIAICLCPNCYFIDFSTSLLFPSGKTLGLRFFSLNSRVILKSSRPEAENFSILPKNLMKKIEIQVFSLTETTMTRKIV